MKNSCKNTFFTSFFCKSFYILFLFISLSCSNMKDKSKIVPIFSFDIGYDEKELGLVNEVIHQEQKNINYCYSNGFYFISDRINNKILKVTESGEILLTIFNKINYPVIAENTGNTDNNQTSDVDYLILYSEYNLMSPGLISADNEKNIFIINSNPDYKKLKNNVVEDKIILKFNPNGILEFELGRNGINTEPFGYIISMKNDVDNNLVIIEKMNDGFQIYKFSSQGTLILKSTITLKNIPLLKNEISYIISFVDIRSDYRENEIYITCQFASKETTMMLETYSIEYEKIYLYSLKENKISKMLLKINQEYEDLSKFKLNQDITELYGDKKSIAKPFQSIIGLDNVNNIYLFQKEIPFQSITANNQYIMKYLETGKLSKTSFVEFEKNALFVNNYYLTNDGRIITYIIKEDKINFVKILL